MPGTKLLLAAALTLTCAVCTVHVEAAPINYGDYSGASVMYLDVTEDSLTDPTPLYGTPSISGNSLYFSTGSFGAVSTNATPTPDTTDGSLEFVIMSSGAPITSLFIEEAGDYSLVSNFGAGLADVSVNASFTALILEVNGSTLSTPIAVSAPNLVFSDALPGDHSAMSWSGSGTLDIAAALAAAQISGSATKVSVIIDNELIARSQAATSARIQKKQIYITPNDPVDPFIPEPASLALLGLGSLALLGRRRNG